MRIRVLSYNIHKGFSTANQSFVLGEIRDLIRESQADLVFLQEVVGHHQEHAAEVEHWPTAPQFEFLADSVWSHFAYGKNAIYEEGHHGNAILSKFPIASWENIDISTNRYEQRGMLHAVLEIPQGGAKPSIPLHAICVHLNLLEGGRRIQVRSVAQRIHEHLKKDDPFVLAGDFNDWRSKVTGPLEKLTHAREAFSVLTGDHARTFPSWLPAMRLDRVYYRGLKAIHAQTVSTEVGRRLSDHLGVIVDLEVAAV